MIKTIPNLAKVSELIVFQNHLHLCTVGSNPGEDNITSCIINLVNILKI